MTVDPSPLDTNNKTIKEEDVQATTTLLNEERYKKKVGYLVKSPSKICFKNKIARWHLRWFVLYDNKQLFEDQQCDERIVELLYYKNHQEEQNHSQPLGRINLRGAKVIPHKGGLHGYQYAMNVVTPLRCIHLCATQSIVHEEWLQKLQTVIAETTTTNDKEMMYMEIDEGYNTWGKSNPPKSPNLRELTKKDFRNQKKHSKTYIEKQEYSNIDSPSQITTPFKSASSFFEPDTDTLDVPPPPLIRRPRSNTTQPIDSHEDHDSQWDISTTFTGPTTCFTSSKTLLRQKSSSTSALFTTSLNASSTTLPRNIKHRIPDTLNEISPSMIGQQKQPIKQRNSVGPTSHWRIK